MTKEEFSDIMLKELKEWSKFINLYDELPWQYISDDKLMELIEFIEKA